MTSIFTKRIPRKEKDTQRECHVIMKAETSVTHIQAKEDCRLPAKYNQLGERPGTDPNLEPLWGAWLCC